MNKYRGLCLAMATTLVLSATGCGSSDSAQNTKKEGPVIYTAPAVEIAKIKNDAAPADTTGASIELLALENPIDYCYGSYDTDMIFEKSDGVWLDALDSEIPINQEMFEAMADNFLHLRAVSKVDDYGTLADCGLTDPTYSFYITDAGKGEVIIYIGNQDSEGNYYVTLDGQTVYTIKESTVDSMVFDYESLVILDDLDLTVTASALKNASIYTSGKVTSYRPSDSEVMERIAEGINGLVPVSYASYYATSQELAAAELTEASRSVFSAEIEIGGETRSLTVYIGGYADPIETLRYIQYEGSDMILVVDRASVDDLTNGLMVEEE